jgi:hypothetical protein
VIVTGAGARGRSVLSRVRELLGDLRDSSGLPGDGAARERLKQAWRSGEAERDLSEIRDRIRRLESFHPELGVETGPLFGLAGEYIERMETRPAVAYRPAGAGIRGAAP